MLKAAKDAAPPFTKVVAVTVLTSLDAADLTAVGIANGPAAQVERLTDVTREAGLDGIVCSGAEVRAARTRWSKGFFVVPGVRLAGSEAGDQKRIITPRRALEHGASIIVIGRPITQAERPEDAARHIASTILTAN